MNNIKYHIGISLLNIDDWFTRRHIYFSKGNHTNFLCKWGFKLVFDSVL